MTYNPDKPVKTNTPLDWLTTGHLSEECKDAILETLKNSDGQHILAKLVIAINTLANPMQIGVQPSVITDSGTTANQANVKPMSSSYLDALGATYYALIVEAMQYVYNASRGIPEGVRTLTWIASAAVSAAGSTSVKAATAGKKHRILGGIIYPSNCWLGVAGQETIQILDVAADIGLDWSIYMPAAAPGTLCPPIILDLKPNGWLCAAVNTAINASLGTVLAGGVVNVTLWGDDE